ncbi:MAG: zinc ribbon domain-containing protein [Desulfovibrio sp.]|nr:zinc ribbon domain-containing protein [Desulfovibrio sp.]
MPIYEYQCPKCGRTFEEWVKVSEAHGEEACPDCGTFSPRLISQTSFVLKGGGWYVTDYGYRKGVKEDSEAAKATDAGAKDEKKGEKSQETKASDSGKTQGSDKNAKPQSKPTANTSKTSSKNAQASPAAS